MFLDEASNIAFGQGNQNIEHSAVASACEVVGKPVRDFKAALLSPRTLDDFREDIDNIELQRDGLDIYSAGRYEGDAKSYDVGYANV